MPRRPKPSARWLLALTWPTGIALTSWDYMWRTTVMHRRESLRGAAPDHLPPAHPTAIEDTEVQEAHDGVGPLFQIAATAPEFATRACRPSALMAQLKTDLNQAAPTKFARFQRVLGDQPGLQPRETSTCVRMPGPWDGPVRVVADDERSFRLATLAGHLEAGQIEA